MMISPKVNILLALYEGNPVGVTSGFPSQKPATQSFDDFELRLNKRLSKQSRDAGDLRRHRVHYDVTAVCIINGTYCI